MSMSTVITGSRRVKVWQADAEWPDDVYVVPAEDLDLVTTDRDIKAANLQLLVEKVLAYDALGDTASVGDLATGYEDIVELARSLKQ